MEFLFFIYIVDADFHACQRFPGGPALAASLAMDVLITIK